MRGGTHCDCCEWSQRTGTQPTWHSVCPAPRVLCRPTRCLLTTTSPARESLLSRREEPHQGMRSPRGTDLGAGSSRLPPWRLSPSQGGDRALGSAGTCIPTPSARKSGPADSGVGIEPGAVQAQGHPEGGAAGAGRGSRPPAGSCSGSFASCEMGKVAPETSAAILPFGPPVRDPPPPVRGWSRPAIPSPPQGSRCPRCSGTRTRRASARCSTPGTERSRAGACASRSCVPRTRGSSSASPATPEARPRPPPTWTSPVSTDPQRGRVSDLCPRHAQDVVLSVQPLRAWTGHRGPR